MTTAGYGCLVGSTFCGALAYADDIVLLAPSINAVRQQLKICSDYATAYKVLFNAKKSIIIPLCINQLSRIHTMSLPRVELMGETIEWGTQEKHLGNIIGQYTADSVISSAIKDFNRRVGMLRSHCKWLAPDPLYQLFKSFCMPLYGSVLWDFSHNSFSRFLTAWRKGIRSLLCLHPRTHCALLAPICKDFKPETQLLVRLIKFLRSLNKSKNSLVKTCLTLAMSGSYSATSQSISVLCSKANSQRNYIVNSNVSPYFFFPRDFANNQESFLIRDLLLLRNEAILSPLNVNVFTLSIHEINFALNFLCTL